MLFQGKFSAGITVASLVYATLNPLDKGTGITLSGGDLTWISNGTIYAVRATQSKTTGKWYWEILVDAIGAAQQFYVGIGLSTSALTSHVGNQASNDSIGYQGNGNVRKATSAQAGSWDSYTASDRIGIAMDLDAGRVWFAKNNVWQASGDPAAGSSTGSVAFTAGTAYFPMVSCRDSTQGGTVNFGATAHTYAPPSGFNAGVYS